MRIADELPLPAGDLLPESRLPAGLSKRSLRRQRKRAAAALAAPPAHDWSDALVLVRLCMEGGTVSLAGNDVSELIQFVQFVRSNDGFTSIPDDSKDLVAAFLALSFGLVPRGGRFDIMPCC